MTLTNTTISERTARLALLVIILISVALRVASAVYQGNAVETLPGIFDQVSYDSLARRVLDGHGFSFDRQWWPITRAGEPTAHWSYLYTLFLTGVYGLSGAQPVVARILQAILVGILLPWVTFRLARRAFDPLVGLVAAALSATYIYFVYYGGALMTEPFYIVAILVSLDLASGPLATPAAGGRRWGAWLALGLALGVAVLLRQLFLVFVPVLLLWIAWAQARTSGSGWAYARRRSTYLGPALALVVIAAMIAPWTIRNYQAFGRFVLLNTNAGYAFFWGNHPIYGTRFVGILPADGPTYQDLIPAELRPLDEAALDQALMRVGMGFIQADPGRYALLSLSRIPEYFKFWPAADSGALSNISRTLSFAALLPFMLYGLALALYRRRSLADAGGWPAVTLLALFATVYTLIHLLSWALIRYRLPVDAVLLVFAGYGLVDLLARLSRNAWLGRAASPADTPQL